MNLDHRRALPLVTACALVVGSVACTCELPASTPTASTPATLFLHPNIERAWQTAAAKKRPLVVMFTSDQCPHCERMLAETYADPAIQRLLSANAETVLAHARDNRELIQRLSIRGFPTTIIVAANGQIVDAVEGFVDAPTLTRRVGRWIGLNATARVQQPPVATLISAEAR
jgi:thioredoxin-related protein